MGRSSGRLHVLFLLELAGVPKLGRLHVLFLLELAGVQRNCVGILRYQVQSSGNHPGQHFPRLSYHLILSDPGATANFFTRKLHVVIDVESI